MSEKVLKHFLVLTKSWINGAIAESGSIVGIHVDPETFQPGPHLKEMEGYEPKHTEAQQKAADEASARREESLAKQPELAAEAKADEYDPDEPPLPIMAPPPNPAAPPANH